jgi:hypothetical protein
MVTVEQAERLAANYLDDLQGQIGMPLQVVKMLDISRGWVFFYNSKAYVELGDIGSMLAGNAPFLINAEDGSLHVFGTVEPVETYLQEYEHSRVNTNL